jgi:hypothetical protein
MRQNRIAYYAAIYPVLIGVMIQVIADNAIPIERAVAVTFALGFAIAGPFVWTRLQHWVHRFVLHADTRIAGRRAP